jgi:hypothetical protein
LTRNIVFGKISVDEDDIICIPNIPPRTSVLFRRSPPSSIRAEYSLDNTTITLTGVNRTAGFDSGLYSSNLEISPKHAGKFSFFAVTFPSDCAVRLVSSERVGILMRGASTAKTCYFNGGHRTVSYDIHLAAGEGGRLKPGAKGELTGIAARHIADVNASFITWEGPVTQVAVAVRGARRHGWGIFREIAATAAPALLHWTPEELPHWGHGHGGHGHWGHHGQGGHGGHHGHGWRGHGGDSDDDDDDHEGVGVVVLLGHVIGLVIAICVIVKIVKCIRRRRARAERTRDADAIPPVHPRADLQYQPVAPVYPGQYRPPPE